MIACIVITVTPSRIIATTRGGVPSRYRPRGRADGSRLPPRSGSTQVLVKPPRVMERPRRRLIVREEHPVGRILLGQDTTHRGSVLTFSVPQRVNRPVRQRSSRHRGSVLTFSVPQRVSRPVRPPE